MSFGPIAHPAGGDEVAARSISASHPRLHMIRRQLVDRKDIPAIDAAIPIALQ
jgi:hypothetical protein